MRRVILAALSCVIFLLPVAGCEGAHEIDDWAYVYTIGIDRGVSDKYRFTFQMPTFNGSRNQSGSGGGTGDASSEGNQLETMTIDTGSFYSAQTLFSTCLSRSLNFAHSKYLVISEELARDNVEPFINGMIRSYQLRRSLYVLVAKGAASDFIRNFNPILGSSVSKTQELIMMNGDRNELFDVVTYNEFLNSMKNSTTQATASLVAVNDFSKFTESGPQERNFVSNGAYTAGEIPRTGGNKFEFCGTAVFNGSKMVGILNGDETRAMELLSGEFHAASVLLPDPGNPLLRVGVMLQQRRKPEVKITFTSEKPIIAVRLYIDGSLLNVQNATEYEYAKKQELEAAVEKYVKEIVGNTVTKCKELNCDVFKFGYKAQRQFLTIQALEEYNWVSHFKDAEVTTEVDFILRRTGTMTKTEGTKSA